jgi:hypothetical protein
MSDAPSGNLSPPGVSGQAVRRGLFGRARSLTRLGDHGRYRLDKILFHDGLGTVWAAFDEVTAARVAIRVFDGSLRDTAEARQRLRSRLHAIPHITHPNVAIVFAHDVSERGPAFMTMEQLSGETLAQRVERDGTIPPAEAASIGAALAQGLAAAHERGVKHGGITPDFVFMTSKGPKLLGVGLGDLAGGAPAENQASVAGDLLGLMNLVKTISAGPFAELGGGSDISAERLPGGAVGAVREQAEREKAEQDTAGRRAAAQERAERERAEREAADRERAEREAVERDQADRERAAWETAEREQEDRERAQRERVERRKADRERAEREAVERDQADRERAEREAVERDQADRERAALEAAEREQTDRERAQREKAERRKADRERAQREAVERDQADRERAQREAAEREQSDRERAEREKAERRKADRERAQREAVEREQSDRERAEREEAEHADPRLSRRHRRWRREGKV